MRVVRVSVHAHYAQSVCAHVTASPGEYRKCYYAHLVVRRQIHCHIHMHMYKQHAHSIQQAYINDIFKLTQTLHSRNSSVSMYVHCTFKPRTRARVPG